jgi:hypothetical protein
MQKAGIKLAPKSKRFGAGGGDRKPVGEFGEFK